MFILKEIQKTFAFCGVAFFQATLWDLVTNKLMRSSNWKYHLAVSSSQKNACLSVSRCLSIRFVQVHVRACGWSDAYWRHPVFQLIASSPLNATVVANWMMKIVDMILWRESQISYYIYCHRQHFPSIRSHIEGTNTSKYIPSKNHCSIERLGMSKPKTNQALQCTLIQVCIWLYNFLWVLTNSAFF